jgi:phosphohistidine phosphatase
MIIASPAKRSRKTAELVALELNYSVDAILYDPRVYEASPGTLLEVVHGLKDAWQDVLLVGHNPSFTELANHLAPCRLENIVTCGVVKLAFDVSSWQEVDHLSGSFCYYDYPKKAT